MIKTLNTLSDTIDCMLKGFGYGFGCLASLETFLTLHGSSASTFISVITGAP